VKLLMSRDDLNINTVDGYGYTPFHWACKRGHIEIVKLLMARDDLNINTPDNNKCYTAFLSACKEGKLEVVKLLMSRDDLNINAEDEWSRTAFTVACKEGHIEIVKLLISENALNCIEDVKMAYETYIALLKFGPKVPREDIIMIGAQLCGKYQLHPSELFGEEKTDEEDKRMCTELTNEISIVLSQRKSARK